jgi:hypothetical protein
VILRERLPDNYDPELPWVVEYERASMVNGIRCAKWINDNVTGGVLFKGRKIGFADYQDALLFRLAHG